MMSPKTRNNAISLIDKYLTYLACANSPLKEFDKCLFMPPDFTSTGIYDGIKIAHPAITAADLDCAWTMRLLGRPSETMNDELFTIYESKTVATGKIAPYKQMLRDGDLSAWECFSHLLSCSVLSSGAVVRDRVYIAHRRYDMKIIDPKEVVIDQNTIYTRRFGGKGGDKDRECARALMGVVPVLGTLWLAHVAITDQAPRITLPTDPTGIKELWKFRDIPEGAKRRDALLHWVSDHWRKDRHDPEIEMYVRSHLRGSKTLVCSGLSVTIAEPLEDRAKLAEIKTDRLIMKIKKLDRRRRK